MSPLKVALGPLTLAITLSILVSKSFAEVDLGLLASVLPQILDFVREGPVPDQVNYVYPPISRHEPTPSKTN